MPRAGSLEVSLTLIETMNSATLAAEASLNDRMDLMELSKEQACPVWHRRCNQRWFKAVLPTPSATPNDPSQS